MFIQKFSNKHSLKNKIKSANCYRLVILMYHALSNHHFKISVLVYIYICIVKHNTCGKK